MKSYLLACGVHDAPATHYVIRVVATDAPPDPRSLVIQIHSALAGHGMHVTAPPALPALLPAELPGPMPRHELSPVGSTPKASEFVPSPANAGLAWGGLVAFLTGIFDRGP